MMNTVAVYLLHSRLCPKAPLVMKQLLPPIFLFHLVQSFGFFFLKPFSAPVNFLTVKDPLYGEKLKKILNVVFDSSN